MRPPSVKNAMGNGKKGKRSLASHPIYVVSQHHHPWSWCFHRSTRHVDWGRISRNATYGFTSFMSTGWKLKGETLSWAWSRATWGLGGRQESMARTHTAQTLQLMVLDLGIRNFNNNMKTHNDIKNPQHLFYDFLLVFCSQFYWYLLLSLLFSSF